MLEITKQVLKVFKFIQRISSKDYFLTGIFGGFAGTLAMDMANGILKLLGITEALSGQIAGTLIMQPIKTKRTKNFVIGQITHMVTGAWLGIPMAYALKKTGKNHHRFKGACMGLFSWLMVYNFTRRFKVLTFNPHLARTHFSQMVANIIFGVATAQTVVSLSPNLFPDSLEYHQSVQNDSLSGNQDKQKKYWNYEGLVDEKDIVDTTIH